MLRLQAAMRTLRDLVHRANLAGVVALLVLAPIAAPGQTTVPDSLVGAAPPAQPNPIPAQPDSIVVQFEPGTPTRELLERARSFSALNDYASAEMVYKGILIREPENFTAMLELAAIYQETGKLQYAMGLLTRASLVKPYDAAIIDRHREVVTKLTRRLQDEVDSLLAKGAYDLALPKLASLLTTEPENAELYFHKANCHLQLGRPDVAMVEIDRALDLHKTRRYFELQEKIQTTVRGREIEELVGKTEALNPRTNPAAKDEALGYLARILELDPDHEWAKELFGALTGDRGSGMRSQAATRLTAFGASVNRVFKTIGGGVVDMLRLLYSHLNLLLLILLVFFVLNSPFTHMLVRGFSPRQSLTGQLKQFTIHEVLTLLNTHQSTGLLKLKTPEMKGRIFLEDGEIYHCKCKGRTGRGALQDLLKNAEQGFFVFTEAVATTHKTVDIPLSLVLMELPERRAAVTSKSILRKKKRQSRMKTLLGSKR